ncbi:hypothetical protein DL770_010303 [Monosporascus sp. CRB-9-2]|nr:hypothetical protein DL770_010303 [Monosporascus sp. CRB-9-2]
MEAVHRTEVVSGVCSALSISILTARIVICRWYGKPIDLSFYLVILSILVLAGKIATTRLYLSLGLWNDELRGPDAPDYIGKVNLADIKIGSIMMLLTRMFLTVELWLQNAILLLLYSNITSGIRLVARMIKISWTFWIISLASIILATFLECRPMKLYWQLKPYAGQCVKAYVQLQLQCISNIVLDLMLLFIAYPLVTLRKRSWFEHVSLYTLFALGTFSMIITIIRLVLICKHDSAQTTRSLWASINIVVTTSVANAPTLYGTLRSARRKLSQRSVTSAQTNGDTQRRASRPKEESWLTMDDDENIPLGSIAPKPPQPLRQAALACDGEPNITAYNPTPPLSYENSQYAHGKQANWGNNVR